MTTNSYPKSTFASDAFYKTMLGRMVFLTITDLGTEEYRVHQHDMYHLIVETEEGMFLLVAKNAIIAAECPDTALPDLSTNISEGVKHIQYKASHKRLKANKDKPLKKDYSHIAVRPMQQEPHSTSREVHVTVKPKRKLER